MASGTLPINNMKIRFGGIRGSSPMPEPDFMKYGGDTTAFHIEGSSGHSLFLDAGTGIRHFAQALADTSSRCDVPLLFSHFHLDHTAGAFYLPSFLPPSSKMQVFSGTHLSEEASVAIQRLFRPPFWPVPFETMGLVLEPRPFEADAKPFLRLGSLTVCALPLQHPGGSTAFRFDDINGTSCVIATDVEWALTPLDQQQAFLHFAQGTSALLFDGEYSDALYATRKGWGHSTYTQALDIAHACGAQYLRVIHHSPSLNDTQLGQIDHQIIRRKGAALAQQGECLRLS